MTQQQLMTRKKAARKESQSEDRQRPKQEQEESEEVPDPGLFRDRHGMELLQDQVGNLATQQLLSQSTGGLALDGPGALAQLQRHLEEEAGPEATIQTQAADEPETALDEARQEDDAVEAGDIKIEEPEIEYYDIQADSLDEALPQIEEPDSWVEVEYEYDPETENGIVIAADISVAVKLRLPRWAGPGRENALPQEQAEWDTLMENLPQFEDDYEETSELPSAVLQGPAWEEAPTGLKTDWRSMLQDFQKEEETLLDTLHRRALVLQQRLLNQPEKEINAIFDQFLDDMEAEEEEYERQREVDEEPDISLGGNVIVQ
jgi:hypothetical protein